jgi:hypothetical protein
MSISTQQLKKILGSFSQIVAKDVSGIKTSYATKKDIEGFAKLSDLNNTYIRKGDIHTEDYVTNVIFRDAYQNRLVKKTDLPALDTIATKQEISNAVAAIQIPSVEGLAKESEVEAKLADYAKTAEVAATYATKEAVNAINGLDADTIATLKNLSEHSDLTAIANKVDNVYTKAETNDKLATKADVTAIPSVEGLAKTTDIESTYAKKSELPDVSGLATKQEVTDAVAGITIPSIEGLAKTTDIEAAYAKKTELPDVSGLATKAEVEALKTGFVTEETLTQNINQFSTNVDSKINEAKGEVEAKVTAVDTKLADYAKKTELPSIEGLAKATEIESTYAKKTELPDVSRLVTKTELSDATVNLATKSEIGIIEGRLTEFLPKSGAASLFAQRAELNDYLRKDDVSDVSVTKAAYDAKVQELESEISTLKAKLAAVASGTTEQRPTENLVVGQQYFDTTLGVPVYWNGTEWHNPFANITTVEVEPH